jgi:NitT/TauT family transport system ATP-binding protein
VLDRTLSSNDQPAIDVTGASYVFDTSLGRRIVALHGVTLTVGRQEFVSIVGPSGCGKSTLLRIITGLLTPIMGRASVLGGLAGPRRGEVSLVFQRPALLPWLNVLDNVLFPLRHMGRPVTSETIDRAMGLLVMMGIADFARMRPKELSGGMQQRVGICRALITDPQLLLMDEPFAALDALTRDELGFELLRLCAEKPKAVLFVTHSIPEAVMLSDRVLIMTARPGCIRGTFDIPLGRPRGPEVTREPIFQELCGHVRDAIA